MPPAGIVFATNDPGAGTSTPASPPASIPGGVLLALTSGAVGGVATASGSNPIAYRDVYDRIYGKGPSLAISERLVGLAILGQVSTLAPMDSGDAMASLGASGLEPTGWWQPLRNARQAMSQLPAPGAMPRTEVTVSDPAPDPALGDEE